MAKFFLPIPQHPTASQLLLLFFVSVCSWADGFQFSKLWRNGMPLLLRKRTVLNEKLIREHRERSDETGWRANHTDAQLAS
jgi:hypothetical protein